MQRRKLIATTVLTLVTLLSSLAGLPASVTAKGTIFLPAITGGSQTADASAGQSQRSTLHGSAPAWANSKNLTGAADPNGGVGFRVYLGWKDANAAEALARAVSDPKSPSYRQFV